MAEVLNLLFDPLLWDILDYTLANNLCRGKFGSIMAERWLCFQIVVTHEVPACTENVGKSLSKHLLGKWIGRQVQNLSASMSGSYCVMLTNRTS
jgi:hypothetical protein